MRLDPTLHQFLAVAAAIRRRDEVAVKQFAQQMAQDCLNAFEVSEQGIEVRSKEQKRRQAERLDSAMAGYMQTLRLLVDEGGMQWLKQQAFGLS